MPAMLQAYVLTVRQLAEAKLTLFAATGKAAADGDGSGAITLSAYRHSACSCLPPSSPTPRIPTTRPRGKSRVRDGQDGLRSAGRKWMTEEARRGADRNKDCSLPLWPPRLDESDCFSSRTALTTLTAEGQ
eukprot:923485-Rhodomonas_salina.2